MNPSDCQHHFVNTPFMGTTWCPSCLLIRGKDAKMFVGVKGATFQCRPSRELKNKFAEQLKKETNRISHPMR
jgi:hypothetical protein